MTQRRWSVIACDARADHRCWLYADAYEQRRTAERHARTSGWRLDTDRGDICPACQEDR